MMKENSTLTEHLKTRIFEYLFDVHRHAFKENTCWFEGDKAFVFSSMIIA